MKKHFIIIVYIILFLSPGITAQIPFQIDNFSISDYHGGIQNWGITVNNGKKYTTIAGMDFNIKEIYEGRLLVEGKIQRVEFLQP